MKATRHTPATDDAALPTTLDATRWLQDHGPVLLAYARRRLKNPSDAEDLVQEALMAALRSRGSYAGRAAVRTWLVGILKHKIIDHHRRRRREVVTDSPPEAALEESLSGRSAVSPAPDERTSNRELKAICEECLDGIPDRQATAFRLSVIEGVSGPEICERMGITPMNYWVLLHRARSRLRGCLEDRWLNAA